MKTLEDMLRERATGDTRAATAVIEIRGGAVRILLGAIGDLGRLIIGVDGNDVKLLHPTQEAIAEAGSDDPADAGDGSGEGGERRAVDTASGEFVDDRDPLKPGENPLDAPARIETEGLDARQPEAVSTTTAISTTETGDGLAGGDPQGNSEIKNPQGDGESGSGDGSGDGQGDDEAKPEAVDPDKHSKDDLIELAKAEGVEPTGTKADIAAAINAKRGVAAS